MAQIRTLPLMPGTKFIVVDDGVEVMRAESLIAGWLEMWNDKGLGNAVEFLLFSGPKSVYEETAEQFKNIDVKFHDYYTIFVDDEDKDDAARLDRIINGNVLQANSVAIVDCLSSLILSVGLAKTLRFVETLSQRAAQTICIYRRDFGRKIPRIETLGTTYLRLEKPVIYGYERDNIMYTVYLNHRKLGGGILIHRVLVCQEFLKNTYEIVREREPLASSSTETTAVTLQNPEKPQASFRIEMNAREQEQRKNTPLPYIPSTASNTINESQIIYEPDSIDDLDEEDPDDDLPF